MKGTISRLFPVCTVVIAWLMASAAQAACTGVVAERPGPFHLAGGVRRVPSDHLSRRCQLSDREPGGGAHRHRLQRRDPGAGDPDIVTMNNAHPMHYSEAVAPGVKYVRRGWDPAGGVADHRLEYRDVRVRNVPTNVRELGGTRYNGNSIFVFEVADLCIAHLGHLHHTLTAAHLAELGAIDVVMAPVDGVYTLNQEEMIEVLQQIGPKIVIPMHMFSQETLERFLTRAGALYAVHRETGSTVVLSRADLPATPEIRVLAGW